MDGPVEGWIRAWNLPGLNGMAPEKISTGQIDKILNADSLATVYSWSCNVGSHLLYGLTLVTTGVTLVYDFTTQLWSFFTYLTSSGVTKTVTAVTTAGVATSAAHGYSDGDIVLIAATNASFNGWHVVTDPTTDTFQLQATGTAFSRYWCFGQAHRDLLPGDRFDGGQWQAIHATRYMVHCGS